MHSKAHKCKKIAIQLLSDHDLIVYTVSPQASA